MRLVLRFGAQLLLMGIIVGMVASVAAGRLLARQLWGVSAQDAQTMLAAVVLVTVVAFLACYLPARRAIRINAMTALRLE
jgi:putative ABC transport system permease protein